MPRASTCRSANVARACRAASARLLVLARALVSPSKLLFLDEPTGSMDTQTELYFIEHLKTALAPDQTLWSSPRIATTCCRSSTA